MPRVRDRSSLAEAMRTPLRRLRADYRQWTSPLRGLPSALIIGAQRSGTTSLFNYLAQHPDVRQPLGKEIHYFDLHYARGIRWYRGRFPFRHRLRGGALTIDASPYYLLHPLAPERAARLLPGVNLVAILRNPIDRAFSHYQHEVSDGREALSFPEAIEREAERLGDEEERLRRDPSYYSYNHHRYSYTLRGRYLEQITRWMQHYPRSRLLVIQSERLFSEPAAVCAELYEFLGLRPHRSGQYPVFYQGNYERAMAPELRARLADYFEPHNRALYQWLGKAYDWR
jgi:Sulfotransferase domain